MAAEQTPQIVEPPAFSEAEPVVTAPDTQAVVEPEPEPEADGQVEPTEPEPAVDTAAESSLSVEAEPEVAAEAAPGWERPAETEPVAQSEPAPTPAPTEPTIEDIARQALEVWRVAAAAGDRQGTVAAASAAVEALRPLAAEHPSTWGPTLVDALERFGDAKFRAGDWWGSRAPKKEAKALARTLGLS